MALTLSNLHKIKSSLQELLNSIDDTIKVKERLSPFSTYEDFQNSEVIQRALPEQFYYFRYFQYLIELNRDKKGYYFYIEHFIPSSPDVERQRYSCLYRLKINTFENALVVFNDLVVECLHHVSKKENQLFYIY